MKSEIKNDLTQKYSNGTILIHWVSVLLILALVPTGFIMAEAQPGDSKLFLLRIHAFVGATIFMLTLLRIGLFFKHKRPTQLETGSSMHNRLIVWTDTTFYILLLLVSISGIGTVILGELVQVLQTGNFTLFPDNLEVPPHAAHQILTKLFIALLIVHILGVINHYIKFKENVLKRILPDKKQ